MQIREFYWKREIKIFASWVCLWWNTVVVIIAAKNMMNFCALVSALDWMFMPQVPYHVRTQGKDPHLWTKKPALTRHQICLHLDLGLPASQTLRNKCLQFKLPSLCCYYRSWNWLRQFSSVQFSHSVVSDSFQPHKLQHARYPVHHQHPEFTQTHVHRGGDAIQPSHPLLSPSPPAPNSCQHQNLFKWVNTSHKVAKILEFQL